MNPLLATAVELQRFFEERRWSFCIIGGIALQRWGEPRVTQDADATLLTGFGGEGKFVRAPGWTGRSSCGNCVRLRNSRKLRKSSPGSNASATN